MILQANEALVVGASAVIEEVKGHGPCLLAELAVLKEGSPLGCPKVVAEDFDAVLEMLYMTVLHAYANLIPLSCGLGVLRLGRNHVIKGTSLTVVVLSEFGIGMAFVVEHLTLRGRDVDRFEASTLGIGDFLREVEDAGVTALGYLPFHLELKVGAELMGEDDVAALALGLAVKEDGTVLHLPFRRHIALAIATPTSKGFAIEDSNETFLIDWEFMTVPQFGALEALRTDDSCSFLCGSVRSDNHKTYQ